MMYPFLVLDDMTEIVHSQMLEDGSVKVYIEKPIENGFKSATCMLPAYDWKENEGFTVSEIDKLQEIIESCAHLILRFSKEGGVECAANL